MREFLDPIEMIQRDQNELAMQLCAELQLTLLGARSLFAHELT